MVTPKGCREDDRHTDTDQAQSEAYQEKHGPRDEARHSERDLQRDTDEGLVGLQTMESTENGAGTARTSEPHVSVAVSVIGRIVRVILEITKWSSLPTGRNCSVCSPSPTRCTGGSRALREVVRALAVRPV